MALGLAGVIGTGVVSFTVFAQRGLLTISNQVELDRQSRYALDVLSRRIREAAAVTQFDPRALTLRKTDGTVLTFRWESTNRQLLQVEGGRTTVLLTGCEAVNFALFADDVQSGTFDLTPTVDAALGKAVQVSWTCSRWFNGPVPHQATATSGMIVLRRK